MFEKVNVYAADGENIISTLETPDVFRVELREDIVRITHNQTRLNSRQPYAVNKEAGMKHSAVSWGTGRAVARCPRVKGSGTRRAGQGAFANFCRKGRMAHPTSVNRRWCRKTNKIERRTARAIAIAATANPALVEGRGHRISQVPMLPLVVSDKIQEFKKTKEAMGLLKKLHLDEDLEKVEDSKTVRSGKGKYRNRRHVMKKGPLLIHNGAELPAFENIMGLDLMDVNKMDLLELAPGGSMGRLVLWTDSAFKHLHSLFGKMGGSSEVLTNYSLPLPQVSTSNLDDYFYSAEIQNLIKIPNLLETGTCRRSPEEKDKFDSYINMYQVLVN